MNRFFFMSLRASALLVITGCEKQTDSRSGNPSPFGEQLASRTNTNIVVISNSADMAKSNNQTTQSQRKAVIPITEKEAVELAKKTVAGAMQLRPDTKITIEKTNEQLVVTFGGPPPPGVRGADYDARVVINPNTGKVEKFLVGP